MAHNYRQLDGINNDTLPNVRNGPPAATIIPTRGAAIGVKYFWVNTFGLVPRNAAANCTVVIRNTYAYIMDTVYPLAPGAVAVVDQHITAAPERAAIRLMAIVLGATRAGVIQSYSIGDADLLATETADEGVLRIAAALAPGAAINTVTTTQAIPHNPVAATVRERAAATFDDLTEAEMSFAWGFVSKGLASAALAGLDLMETGHHYLSAGGTPRTGAEKQMVAAMGNDGSEIWRANIDTCRDLFWHKAIHPIDIVILKSMATSQAVARSLHMVGMGAAAIRLPYKESTLKGASAGVEIVNCVQPFVQSAGGTINVDRLKSVVAIALSWSPGDPAPVGVPVNIRTRQDYVMTVVKPVSEASASAVAVATGVFIALMEGTDQSVRNNSLLKSKYVKRAMTEKVAAFAQGMDFYKNMAKFTKVAVEHGEKPIMVVTDTMVAVERVAIVAPAPAAAAPVVQANVPAIAPVAAVVVAPANPAPGAAVP